MALWNLSMEMQTAQPTGLGSWTDTLLLIGGVDGREGRCCSTHSARSGSYVAEDMVGGGGLELTRGRSFIFYLVKDKKIVF